MNTVSGAAPSGGSSPGFSTAFDWTQRPPDGGFAATPEVAALLASANPGWNGAIGRGGVITFSFAQTPEAGTVPDSFGSLNADQAHSARLALGAWADVSGISFVEVPDRAGG